MTDGELHRLTQFKPLTGKLEYLLSRAAGQYLPRPEWVTTVLANTVERIGTLPMTTELAAHLSVGDRIFLMLQLGIRCDGDQMWLSPTCESCGEQFDISVKRSELPVQEAGSGYPSAGLRIRGREVGLRVVNGEDQHWLNENLSVDPVMALLSRCIQTVDGKPAAPEFVPGLDREDCRRLETAIQSIGPDVDCSMLLKCPGCTTVQQEEVDPYWLGQTTRCDLDDEVHMLAFYYHWTESEILKLTRERRRTFIQRIDKERGRHV